MNMLKNTHVDSKRDNIIRASIELFSEKGIEGTSVKEIGSKAGVSDAALYKHFPSKTHLAEIVYVHYMNQYTKVIDHFACIQASFDERLALMTQEIVNMIQEDRFGLLLLGQNHYCLSDTIQNHRQPVMALIDFIHSAVQNGEIPDQNPILSATLIIGAVLQLPFLMDTGLLQTNEQCTNQITVRIRGLLGSI